MGCHLRSIVRDIYMFIDLNKLANVRPVRLREVMGVGFPPRFVMRHRYLTRYSAHLNCVPKGIGLALLVISISINTKGLGT